MNLNDDFFRWISEHANDNPAKLRMQMRGRTVAGIDASVAIMQIECRRKYAAKFAATLQLDPHFFFPGSINAEQATGDRMAQYHASLIAHGSRVADLTAGLGIDIMHIARKCTLATAVEQQPQVADALRFNAANSSIDNLNVVCADCRQWLRDIEAGRYDCFFIDPARRADDGSRVFALADCNPDLAAMQTQLLTLAPRFVAKLSPMLDITHLSGEIPTARTIIALGTATECKELIVVADRHYDGPPEIHAVTLLPDGTQSDFAFTASQEHEAEATYGIPRAGDVLFEPWPALMKAAPQKLLSQHYRLTKIAPNTRLYYTGKEATHDNLPGNLLDITAVLPYSSSEIKRFARRWPKASVTARNFGISADALRKKLAVRDGGPTRVFGVTDSHGSRYLIVTA